jgi:capsular polysaccharide transport system permease protein
MTMTMPSATSQTYFSALTIQLRVIGALLMREIITRYGRHNVGFLWLFLEPMLFTTGVILLWSATQRMHGSNLQIAPFVVTGYSTVLLWRNCSFRGIKAIESNRSLLNHRNVKLIDIFAARMLLEVVGVTASFTFVMLVLYALDSITAPHDILLMLGGWLLMAWFSANLGVILGCLSEHSDLVERLWHPSSYFLLSISGAFFMVAWLPDGWRSSMGLVPMVNATEMLRAGYFGPNTATYFDTAYTVAFCACMSLVALMLVRDTRALTDGVK